MDAMSRAAHRPWPRRGCAGLRACRVRPAGSLGWPV